MIEDGDTAVRSRESDRLTTDYTDYRFQIWDFRFGIWDLGFQISDLGFRAEPENRALSIGSKFFAKQALTFLRRCA